MRLGWVIAYSAGLFVASVLALPCWNAFLYAGLGGVAAFTCRRATRSSRRMIGLVVLVAAVGFLDEVLQVFLPHRYFQWSDVLLNWLGLVVGVIVVGVTAWLGKS